MSVIVARAALDEAQKAVAETRRLVPDSPLARAALAAAWDARCALRRAIDAASRGDQERLARAGAEARAAGVRAAEVAERAVSWTGAAAVEASSPVQPLSPATGIVPGPGSSPVAPRSLVA